MLNHRYLSSVIVLIGFLFLWWLVSYLNLFPGYALPSPVSVISAIGMDRRSSNQGVILKNQRVLETIVKNQQTILKLLKK